MIDTNLQPTNYVRYALSSSIASDLLLPYEPLGWAEDQIEYTRHRDYHGILTSFSGELGFFKAAREYIINDFKALGLNSNLQLRRYELRDINGTVQWSLEFTGIVDYSTYKDAEGILTVRFNSNQLEELIKTRKDDDFELERRTDIEGNVIPTLVTDKTQIKGVLLATATRMNVKIDDQHDEGPPNYWSRSNGEYQQMVIAENNVQAPVLEMLTDTNDRISTPDTADPNADPASKMFFVDSTDPNVDVDTVLKVKVSYRVNADFFMNEARYGVRPVKLVLMKYVYNSELAIPEYEVEYTVDIKEILAGIDSVNKVNLFAEGEFYFPEVAYNEGYVLGFTMLDGNAFAEPRAIANVNEFTLNVSSESEKAPSENCDFLFVHDVMDRLSLIATGESGLFKSHTFGRVEDGYTKDGKYGLVGLISGFWIRQFSDQYNLYKSMKLSMEDVIKSLNAVFNTGLGIERIDGKKTIVIEDLKYFYQNKVKVLFDGEVSEYSESVIKDDYFSSLEIGYEKGGDYNDTLGLDEPNVKTNWTTPINKNKKKYRKISSVRADDIGSEIIRRKPASLYPDEDTSQDEHIWLLDLKRKGDGTFLQLSWEDRLLSAPRGLSYNEDFKSFLFTPLRMLLRHGWIIRAGMDEDVNRNKYLDVNSSEANKTLGMNFIGDKLRFEGDPVLIKDLPRPRTLPIRVSFKYAVTPELIETIKDKSEIDWEGQKIMVPNYYFKFQWTDIYGKTKRGYLTSLKLSTNEFEFILANDNDL
jgi:hypothetical protein